MPVNEARTVKIFSNKPDVVFQPTSQQGRPMRLMPSSINHISVHLEMKSPLNSQSPTVINCVDTHTGELVYSWLMIVETIV